VFRSKSSDGTLLIDKKYVYGNLYAAAIRREQARAISRYFAARSASILSRVLGVDASMHELDRRLRETEKATRDRETAQRERYENNQDMRDRTISKEGFSGFERERPPRTEVPRDVGPPRTEIPRDEKPSPSDKESPPREPGEGPGITIYMPLIIAR
jgi:hypothetical protein